MSYLGLCEVCNSDPVWQVERRGDVVTSWACDDDLYAVCHRMQRDFEISELVVKNAVKMREWAELSGTLAAVGAEASSTIHIHGDGCPYDCDLRP